MKKLLTLLLTTLTLTVTHAQAQWSELGGFNSLAANSSINALCTDKFNNVYAAGSFTNASGKQYVAKFDGIAWSELGGLNALNANNSIFDITTDTNGYVYAAGNFTNAVGSKYVAKWDGTVWSAVGGVTSLFALGDIKTLHFDKFNNLYAAGRFSNSFSNFYVAKWDGFSWTELGGVNSLAANGLIETVTSDTLGNIYAAGWFQNSFSKHYVAKYNGNHWSEVGIGIDTLKADAGIVSLTCDNSGNVYCTGAFNNQSGYRYVAMYDGFAWSELGGTNSLPTVNSLRVIKYCNKTPNSVYAGGSPYNINGFTYAPEFTNNSWGELGGINSLYNFAGVTNITSLVYDKFNNVYIAGGIRHSPTNYYVAKYTAPNSIEENSKDLSFTAFPNPALNYLNIVLHSNENLFIAIENTLGEIILKKIDVKQSNLQIDVSSLEPGIYFLTVSNKNKSVTKKFIKTN
jgi:hypothetical protein